MNLFSLLWLALAMVAATALSTLVARRVRLSHSIVLVLVGAALAFIPEMPRVKLNPDLVLLLLLPPLLYSSGVGMSWPGFRKNLSPIMLLAVGCVLLTASVVAVVMHYFFGMSWAVGFVLGSVVSPPDAVAPMTIARRLAVPRQILVVLEGEGLVNDATALILFSFAVGAVVTGGVSFVQMGASFLTIVFGELAWGVALGWASLRVRAWANNPQVEMTLALLVPFLAFWPPHELGGSGVLASVTAGLYVSWNGPALISPATRLQGFFVWDWVVYIIEGLVFLLTGLQARAVFEGPDSSDWTRTVLATAATILVVVVVRFVWVFAATYVGRALRSTVESPGGGWRAPFLVAFTGIRGGISLVAALSIPEFIPSGEFPERDLILVVTFGVILASLVGQGTTLPRMIQVLGLDKAGRREARMDKKWELAARVAGIDAALARLNTHRKADASDAAFTTLRHFFLNRKKEIESSSEAGKPAAGEQTAMLQLELLAAERDAIAEQYGKGKLSDEARRRIERELDLDDARLRQRASSVSTAVFFETEPDPTPAKDNS